MKYVPFLFLVATASSFHVDVAFDATAPLHEVSLTYLSFNIDTGSLYNNFAFHDPIFSQLVQNIAHAAPTQVRIGGGAAENTLWTGVGGPRAKCSVVPGGLGRIDICLDSTYLEEICIFAHTTGITGIVWDFNAALRVASPGPWNSTNAVAMLSYLDRYLSDCPIAAWELGNEVEDSDLHNSTNITGAELAADYQTFRKILSESFPRLPQTIYGPDACCEGTTGTFLTEFTAGTAGALDAVTVHNYPIPRNPDNSCRPEDFTNKTQMMSLTVVMAHYANWSRAATARGVPMILGETATSAHGGCDGLSNRFMASFTFILELSIVAEHGYSQMNRQDLAGWSSETCLSYYALLGPGGWSHGALGAPHPDYFVAILFKQLVGRRVLRSSASSATNGPDMLGWDSHVWCAKDKGSVVISFFNMQNVTATVTVMSNASLTPRTEYVLTSPDALTADAVNLNGKRMTVNADGTLPQYPIPGKVVTGTSTPMVVAAWSLGFIVLHDAAAAACTTSISK